VSGKSSDRHAATRGLVPVIDLLADPLYLFSLGTMVENLVTLFRNPGERYFASSREVNGEKK
jgi:hypothetical protein